MNRHEVGDAPAGPTCPRRRQGPLAGARQPVTPVSQPPIVVPMRDLETTYSIPPDKLEQVIHEQFRAYRATLRHDQRHVLERFEIVDMARKVVGVGTVGTRAFVVLLQGRDQTDPLFLQVKEATASVLEDHLSASRYKQHGERVVYGQRMLQAASDISARRAMPTRTSRTTRRSWARSIPAGCKPSKACETADWRGEPRIPPMGGNRVVSLPHQRPGSREIGEREVDADELDPGLNGQVQELSMPLSMPLGGARYPPVRRRPAHGSIRGGSSPAGTARPATPRPGRSAASGRCRKVQHRRPAAGRVLSLVQANGWVMAETTAAIRGHDGRHDRDAGRGEDPEDLHVVVGWIRPARRRCRSAAPPGRCRARRPRSNPPGGACARSTG
jgi:hypothetical protein